MEVCRIEKMELTWVTLGSAASSEELVDLLRGQCALKFSTSWSFQPKVLQQLGADWHSLSLEKLGLKLVERLAGLNKGLGTLVVSATERSGDQISDTSTVV